MYSSIFDLIREYARDSEHPDLKIYRRDLDGKNPLHVTPLKSESWIRRISYFCKVGNFYNRRILEVGCGFGWDAVAISAIGNNQVVASDILPSMIEGVVECLAAMRKKGKVINVEPLLADICKTDLPSGSFDGIYSSEAVEHVHDLEVMFKECHRLLKPGGRLLIANDSNRLNTKFREDTFKMWVERDTSWEHAAWLKTEIRPVEHRDAKPYAAMREDFIRRASPNINEADLEKLKETTAGMIGPEIEQATRFYLESGTLPTRPTYSWCRNPETGEYAERLLDPFELREMLGKAGFKTKIGHAFTRFPYTLMNNVNSRPISARIFKKRPLFVLCAEKGAA